MRKLLKAAAVLGVGVVMSVAATGAAQAAVITTSCPLSPVTFASGTGGPTTVSCPAFSGGGTLTGVSLELLGDYSFGGTTGTNDVLISFAVNNPAGVTWADAAPSGHVTGGFNSTVLVDIFDAATAFTPADFASAFGVDISSLVISGTVDASSGGVIVTYTYTPATVPEPITLSLFGAGLAGAAALRRRKKKIA